MTLDEIIGALALAPHPEGGFFRETFRSPVVVYGHPPAAQPRAEAPRLAALASPIDGLPHGAPRAASTAIYYLLRAGDFAAWHRVRSDEVWHHYAGAPLSLFLLDGDGAREITLGDDLLQGQQPQAVVPAGVWQAAEARQGWALCGCTVAPGFDFADWEMPDSGELLIQFPSEENLIRRFTRTK